MKERSISSIKKCWEMLGCYSMIAWVVGIVTAANLVNAVIGYDVDALGGFGVGLCTLFSMLLSAVGLIIVAIYGQNYQFLCVVPLKASTVPQQMTLLVDIIHGLCAVVDLMIMVLCGYAARIPMRLILLFAVYIIAHVMLSALVPPGLRGTNLQETSKGKGILLYFLYLACIVAVMVLQILLTQEFVAKESVQTFTMIALPIAIVIAVFVRIVTYRITRNKVRMLKVYREKKARKARREVSYV